MSMRLRTFTGTSPIWMGSNVYRGNSDAKFSSFKLKVCFDERRANVLRNVHRLNVFFNHCLACHPFTSSKNDNFGLIMSKNGDSEIIHEERLNSDVVKTLEDLNTHVTGDSFDSEFELSDNIGELKVHFIEEIDAEALSERILSLSKSNRVRSALELCMSVELSGLQPSTHAYNSLIACLLRNGHVKRALAIFSKLEDKGLASSHTYSLILKSVALFEGFDSALKLFTKWEQMGLAKKYFDPIVHNTMISVCARANDWMQMEAIWRLLKEHDHIGTEVTYAILVCTFVRCGQTELALDAFQEMIQNDIMLREDTLNALIGGCTKEGKWDVALNVFQLMVKLGYKGDAIVYNSLINCLGKAGKTELAFEIYGLMKSSGCEDDSYTWHALLNSLYKKGAYVDTLQLFERLRREKNCAMNSYLYNVALMSCKKLGLWDKSLQLLWKMEESGMSISTESYNHVVGACEVARMPKVALEVYKHMVDGKRKRDMFTYLSLIRACIWGSLWTEATEILSHAGPNASIYNTLIQGMCLRGETLLAKKVYKRMQIRGLKPDGKTRAFMLQYLDDQ